MDIWVEKIYMEEIVIIHKLDHNIYCYTGHLLMAQPMDKWPRFKKWAIGLVTSKLKRGLQNFTDIKASSN